METNALFDLAQWSALLGFLTPIVVAVLKQSGLSKAMNTAIAIVFSLVVSWVTVLQNGEFSWDAWATSFITLYTVAVATYYGLWRNVGEEKLQDQTSFIKTSVDLAA